MEQVLIIKKLQHPNGLFAASAKNVKTGYNRIWLRDNIYTSLSLEGWDEQALRNVYWKIFDVLRKFECKIDKAIETKPTNKQDYIHPIYTPELEEIDTEWGFKQNDSIGLFIFKVADLTLKGVDVVRDKKDYEILQKLVKYLDSIMYWRDLDNGMWEENEEVHASSVGACLAGLKLIQHCIFRFDKFNRRIVVPRELIVRGEETLKALLPRESPTKEVDMALLSLVYPYGIVNEKMRNIILKNVEEKLARKKGVIRYAGDKYYNKNGEAEWTMGLAWLAVIYKKLGNKAKYQNYLKKTLEVMNANGELPELYYANSNEHNENTPLGWAQSLFAVAMRS